MDLVQLRQAVTNGNINWQRHVLERLMERGIAIETIKNVLLTGDVIEEYPDDTPYPSALLLAWIEMNPYHAVVSFDSHSGYCFVITAYIPDLEHFESDYKTRRKREN